MSVFGSDQLKSATEDVNMNELVEAFIYDDISRGSDEQIHEFIESAEAKALMEKGVFRKPTMMRLGKEDDEKRRIKLAAYQLAKDKNDPLWKQLKLNRKKERQLINKIMKKYGNAAKKLAKSGQKEYIKQAKSAK